MSSFRNIKTTSLILLSSLYLAACSSPQPENQWQYDAASMGKNFQLHFLQDKRERARLDLEHARRLASRSAELKTLIDIELASCAMQLASLEAQPCDKAERLLALQPDLSQDAYLKLLAASVSSEEIIYLPPQYREFAKVFIEADALQINKELTEMRPLTSRLIASALAKDAIDSENIQELIDALSFNGYKRPLLAWLTVQMDKEADLGEKTRLQEKIDILTSH